MSGWVYIVRSDTVGPLKIGMTRKLRVRRKAIRCPKGDRVNVVRAFPVEYPHAVESRAHDLIPNRIDGGEWFNVTAEQAIAAIQQAKIDFANGWRPKWWE